MGATFIHLYYHLIWTTYKRFPWIDEELEQIILKLIQEKVIEYKSELLAFGSTSDHIHLLVRLHPTKCIAGFVGETIGYTSFVIANKICPDLGFCWQGGYGALTVSQSDLSRLTKYIENQKEHHHHETIQKSLELMID